MPAHDVFAWQPHPDAWLLVVLLGGGYTYALRAWRPEGRPGATRRQQAWFFLGVAVLWLASDWPIHGLSTRLFSVHMLQHLLYSLVAAPLLLLGIPAWLHRRLLRPAIVQRAMRVLTKPLVALLVFNLWIAVYHWPAIVNLSVRSDLAHFAVHIVWIAVSLLMWWPVLSPLPEFPHLSYPGRMLYLFGQSIVPTVPASFLTFSQTAIYGAYIGVTETVGFSAVDDQQVSGLLMKIGGGLLLWGIIAVLFFRWAAQEQSGGPDPLYWHDLEADLARVRN